MDASSGSATARVVAVGRAVGVGGYRDPHVGALLPASDRAAIRVARAVGAGRSSTVMAWSSHAGLRMLAVDAAVERAMADLPGATLVIVGAGYDTRAWRLLALEGRRVLELDHPATQADKLRRLPPVEQAGAELTLHPADLAHDDLDEVLVAAGHAADAPTVWLWEAVVPYLPESAVNATLAVLGARSLTGSRMLVTTVRPELVSPRALGRALARPIALSMHRLGEPLLLTEPDGAVASRLARHGFLDRGATGPSRWATDAGLRTFGPLIEERLHVAERVR